MANLTVIHLKTNQYTHILDNNASATILRVGPLTYTKSEHEHILCEPKAFVVVPPRHYCTVENPVQRKDDGTPVLDSEGQAVVQLGDSEIRMDCAPFPLYPGEQLSKAVPLPLQVLPPNMANRVRATRNFDDKLADETVVKRIAGDEWLVEGPCTYYPHVCKEVVQTVKANFIGKNEALKLRAVNKFVDRTGTERKVGSEWLWAEFGPYMPSVDEMVVEVVKANILSEMKAIHVHCLYAFTDCFGQERRAGDQWLVTNKDTETYIPTPNETVSKEVPLCVLNKKQYCIVVDPYDSKTKMNQLSVRKLIKGPSRFFLHPGEKLEGGCAKDVYVMMADEALLLEASETFTDENGVAREAGDLWMINGPCEYIPPVQVVVVEKRTAMAMHEYEGVYVRDLKTGVVRSQMGPCSYMLQAGEELWEKELSQEVEGLLGKITEGSTRGTWSTKAGSSTRDRTRVIVYSVPHNSVCQIFDYKTKTSRCICGPDMVSLNPDEEFTVISLSGGKPKVAGRIKCLSLFLGPDFMTDNIKVETADHARLELQLSYSWRFAVDPKDKTAVRKVFSVPDFVGDSCKAIASKIRGCCAGVTFDNFHKNSSSIIRYAVFGSKDAWISGGRPLSVGDVIVTADGKKEKVTKIDKMEVTADSGPVADPTTLATADGNEIKRGKWPHEALHFNNGLVISNVDIQSMEPVDQKTKDSLIKSVQLAIHITTQSQEAAAKHKATEEEQKARGELESQLIKDKAMSERERMKLLRLKAESQTIETSGAQRAEAQAAAEAARVEAKSLVELARMKAEAQKIQSQMDVDLDNARCSEELRHQESMNSLEVDKAQFLARIEADKFKKTVGSIGKDTIQAIARAGPENQVRLLKALNLQGYMVTDGSSPINLFNAAQGMTGQMANQANAIVAGAH